MSVNVEQKFEQLLDKLHRMAVADTVDCECDSGMSKCYWHWDDEETTND